MCIKTWLSCSSDDEEQPAEEKPEVTPAEATALTENGQVSTEGLSKSKRKRLKRKAAAAAASAPKVPKEESDSKDPKEADGSTEDVQAESSKKKVDTLSKKGKDDANQETKNSPQSTEKTKNNNAFKNNKKEPKNVQNGFQKPQNQANKSAKTKSNQSFKTTESAPAKAEKPNGNNPFNKPQSTSQQRQELPPIHKNQGGNKKGPRNANGPNPFKKSNQKPSAPFPAKKTNNFKAKNKQNNNSGITDDRLKAYGINPRKFHKREKYGKKDN